MIQNPPQTHKIKLNNQEINYTLKTSKRARRMRLTIQSDGSLIATKPRWISRNMVEKFIAQKADWVMSKMDYYKCRSPLRRGSNGGVRDYLKNKDKAFKFIAERILHYNKIYNYKFNKITIRNQKTRWGSCSKRGNLNFNYKILFLPRHLADYIIIHELCHLKELNHSQRFWDLVAKVAPDYLAVRKELRKRGMELF